METRMQRLNNSVEMTESNNSDVQMVEEPSQIEGTIFDGRYVLVKRLDCSNTHEKMVFLVSDKVSCTRSVLKFYTQGETNAFIDEVNRNSVLIQSSHTEKST